MSTSSERTRANNANYFPTFDSEEQIEKPELEKAPMVPDADMACAILEPFRAKANAMLTQAKKIAVTDQDTQVEATELAGHIKEMSKDVERARKDYVTPFNDHVKIVNNTAKIIAVPLDDAFRHLTRQLSAFATRLELERRKAEEEARKQAEAEQRRLNEEAKAAGVEAPLVPEILPAKESNTTVRTAAGSSHQRKGWDFTVEKSEEIPREYLILDERAVRAAIRNGVRTIPGLKIFETSTTVIR